MKKEKLERQEREMRERWAAGEPTKSGTSMKVHKVPCPLHPNAVAYTSDRANRCLECRKAWRQAHLDQVSTYQQYNTAKNAAVKHRGISFTLTCEQYAVIISKPCVYAIQHESGIRMGIDQKTAKDGYTLENSVPCCYRHNMMKSNIFTYEQAREIALVYKIRCGNHPGRKKREPKPAIGQIRNRVRATSVLQSFAVHSRNQN